MPIQSGQWRNLLRLVILVLAKGYFSHYAALNRPTGSRLAYLVDREWFLSPPLDNCIPCLPDGSFDRVAFERQLFLLIPSKCTAETKA